MIPYERREIRGTYFPIDSIKTRSDDIINRSNDTITHSDEIVSRSTDEATDRETLGPFGYGGGGGKDR